MGDLDYGASERKPTLSEVLDRARRLGEVHTMIPAVVHKYQGGRKVDVQVLVKRAVLDETGARQVRSVAIVVSVPIVWPGAGGYTMTFPICDGTNTPDGATSPPPATIGMLMFAERSIDKWLSGSGGEVDPEIDHTHHLSDGIFVPELIPFGASSPAPPTDHAVLGKAGGVQIHLRGSSITIGDESGAAKIPRDDKLQTELNALKSAFNGHTHTAGGFTAGTTGVTGTSGGPSSSYTPGATGSSQGKVQ